MPNGIRKIYWSSPRWAFCGVAAGVLVALVTAPGVASAQSVHFSDPFTRSASTGISGAGTPDPPGAWIESSSGGSNCDVEISGNNDLLFQVDPGASSCKYEFWYAFADEPLGSIDHCAVVQLSGISNWPIGRGPRLVLRSSIDTSSPGIHYEPRCDTPDCQSVKVEAVSDTGQFQSAHTAETDCDDELPPFSEGDYLGACVAGTGANTTFQIWNLNGGSLPSDLENADTWGTPSCDLTSGGAATFVDTGLNVGVGIAIDTGSFSSTYNVDNFSGTDKIPGLDIGPLRSSPLPDPGLLPAGTTGVLMGLTTDSYASCKYAAVPGVDYDSMPFSSIFNGGTVHLNYVPYLQDGFSYERYARCRYLNAPSTTNTTDLPIKFSVDSPLGVVGLTATGGNMKASLDWDDSLSVLDHDHWNVEWKQGGMWPGTPITDPVVSSALISPLTNDLLHDFRVQDCNAGEVSCSAWVEQSATPMPGNYTVTAVSTTNDPYFNSSEPGCDNLTVGPGPANAAYLACDDFEDGSAVPNKNATDPINDGWEGDGYASYPDPDGPTGNAVPGVADHAICGDAGFNSDCAMRYEHNDCTCGAGAQPRQDFYGGGVNEIYVRYYMKFSASAEDGLGFDNNVNGNHKIGTLESGGTVDRPILLKLDVQRRLNIKLNITDEVRYGNQGLPLIGPVDDDHWYFIEIHMKLNTPDVADGLIEIWLNDCGTADDECFGAPDLFASHSDVNYGGGPFDLWWAEAWTNNSLGGALGDYYVDQFIMSTSPIGFMTYGVP